MATRNKVISLRLAPEIHSRLESYASKQNQSLYQASRELIERALADRAEAMLGQVLEEIRAMRAEIEASRELIERALADHAEAMLGQVLEEIRAMRAEIEASRKPIGTGNANTVSADTALAISAADTPNAQRVLDWDGAVFVVRCEYNPDFPALLRRAGGQWQRDRGVWTLPGSTAEFLASFAAANGFCISPAAREALQVG